MKLILAMSRSGNEKSLSTQRQTLTVPSKSQTFDNGDSAQPPRFHAESMGDPYSLVKN
jgi:hypothetical protein